MLITIEGYFENGEVVLKEPAPTTKRTKVLVTFTEEVQEAALKPRQFGTMKGEIWMSEDFNEPLDDLKEYM